MRVCLNLAAATAGGQLTRARAFLERFHRYAPEAELYVLRASGALRELSDGPRRVIVDVPTGQGPLKAVRRTLWENLCLPELLKRHRLNIYLTFSHYLPIKIPASVSSIVGVSTLAPFSSQAWCAESPIKRIKLALLKRSILSSAHRADRVIALSEACRNTLLQHGIEALKVVVITNGVTPMGGPLAGGNDVFRDHGIARPYLLFVSHFYRYKDHFRLIEAFAALPPDTRDSYQLVLVGKPYDRSYFDRVLAYVEGLDLRNRVIVIAGEHGERLQRLYQKATLFVFPSLVENSPNCLLEAMSAGAPVIACNLPPMPEFGGNAARYFMAGNVNDLKSSIAELLSDPTQLEAMRARSQARSELFSWDVFVSQVVVECERMIRIRVGLR